MRITIFRIQKSIALIPTSLLLPYIPPYTEIISIKYSLNNGIQLRRASRDVDNLYRFKASLEDTAI